MERASTKNQLLAAGARGAQLAIDADVAVAAGGRGAQLAIGGDVASMFLLVQLKSEPRRARLGGDAAQEVLLGKLHPDQQPKSPGQKRTSRSPARGPASQQVSKGRGKGSSVWSRSYGIERELTNIYRHNNTDARSEQPPGGWYALDAIMAESRMRRYAATADEVLAAVARQI